jgi:hypothetical protein
VGYYNNGDLVFHTLVLHWNGTAWSIVPSPNVGTGSNLLNGVSAVSANDVWAVGYYDVGGSTYRTLALHWDGTTWSVVPTPYVEAGQSSLSGVSTVAADDVWAVGYQDDFQTQTMILHWDGTAWSVVPSPNVEGGTNKLDAVSAVSATDVWAAGSYRSSGVYRTLALHWDGTAWSLVPSPNVGTLDNTLNGISGVSASDVWAVGSSYDTTTGNTTLALHWDGTAWSVVPSPNSGSLNDVKALAANDVWAVGHVVATRTLIMYWDGTAWSVVPSPNPGNDSYLWGVSAVSANDVWAAGSYNIYGSTFVERYICSSTCSIQFTDVPADNTFYPFVRCLACQGIVSGYPCGEPGEPCNPNNDPYFRPNAYVTRGQLAKIVSESAGFSDAIPSMQRTFTDVPYGSTFWLWVERLSNRDVMAGYACGGPNEPCDPQSRPYFRPGAGATRGQLTKIVSNAAGFDDTIPPTRYTFTDVPPSNTFWAFVERLLLNRPGVMGGYACGGPGEPCDGENRPYFRPNNPLTRGQTSKIVSNTFIPECSTP